MAAVSPAMARPARRAAPRPKVTLALVSWPKEMVGKVVMVPVPVPVLVMIRRRPSSSSSSIVS